MSTRAIAGRLQARWLLLAILCVFSIQLPAFSQPDLTPDDIAGELARLLTVNRSHAQGAVVSEGYVTRWEHSITWTIFGNTTNKGAWSIWSGLSTSLSRLSGHSKFRIRADHVAPSVVTPGGYAPDQVEWAINAIAKPEISFELRASAIGAPAVTATFAAAKFSASSSANLIVFYGERNSLRRLKSRLPSHGMEVFESARVAPFECSTFLWPSRQGLSGTVLLIDDQLPLPFNECFPELTGRALGIRGEVDEKILSVYARGRRHELMTWPAFDVAVLSMLYDPRMRSGMDTESVTRLARQLHDQYFRP